MTISKSHYAVARIAGLIIASLCFAQFIQNHSAHELVKLNSNPEEYIRHKRQVFQSSSAHYFFIFGTQLFMGTVYLTIIEVIAVGLRFSFQQKTDSALRQS